jgi:DNA-binding XRE family transcriptional regulator
MKGKQGFVNPLVAIRQEKGLTRRELAVLVDAYEINGVLQGILQIETGVRVPPSVSMWGKIERVLAKMGVNISEFEKDVAAWRDSEQGE